jgi:hypothetical protein
MAIQRAIFALTIFFAATTASAEGQLSLSFQNVDGFNKILVNEKEGVREGSWVMGGGSYPLLTYTEGTRLHMNLGPNTDYLDFEKYDEVHTWYRGVLWSLTKFSFIDSYVDKKGDVRIRGTIAEQNSFEIYTDKAKGEFYMYWDETSFLAEFHPPSKNANFVS